MGIPLVVATVVACLYWPGRTFPGFFLLRNHAVPSVGLYEWTGWSRIPFHRQVVSADGAPMVSQAQLYALAAARPPGTAVEYGVRDGDTVTSTAVPTMRFGPRDFWLTLAPFLVNGVVIFAMAVVVGLLQPRRPEAMGFLAFGTIFGVLLLTGPPLYHPTLSGLTSLNLLATALWPASFVHLGLVFPAPRPLRGNRNAWIALAYAISLGLWVWCLREFYAPAPSFLPVHVIFASTAAAMAFDALLFAQAYRQVSTTMARRRVRTVLVGFLLSSAIAFVGLLDNANRGGSFPINLSILTPLLFYVAVGWSIARHDLFDIDRLVKQAVVYLTLTAGITLGYAGTLVVVGWLPWSQVITGSPAFVVAFVVLIATIFGPLRARVQRVVDRMFFREQIDYRATISEMSGALTSVIHLDAVLARVGTTLRDGLAPSSFTVLLWVDGETRCWRMASDGRLQAAVPAHGRELQAALERAPRRALRIPDSEDDPSGAWAPARALDGEVVVPLARAGDVIGAFVLGGRRSGVPYTSSDLEVLDTLAAQSAIALQNAILFRDLQQLNAELESKVRARTAALEASNTELSEAYRRLQDAQAQLLQTEKMASLGQLVAGMAHEINTPITAVAGNVPPLRRELDRLRDRAALHGDATLEKIAGRMAAIFEVMARGAERTAGIVQDLRVFSRVEETQPLPMDVHDSLDVSLRLLRPRWADRITIERDYGDVPQVEAAAGQVNQVFMNLLANACDAIADTGTIRITTRADATTVTVTIADDGLGIPEDVRSRVFDPFFTTKPLGQGMGLGLSICAGIVASHGGTIDLASTPGVGTTVTVELPLRSAPRERVGDASVG